MMEENVDDTGGVVKEWEEKELTLFSSVDNNATIDTTLMMIGDVDDNGDDAYVGTTSC